MYDKTLIVIIVLIIGFVLLNLNTSVVEGLKNKKKKSNIKDSNIKESDISFDVNNNTQGIKLLTVATVQPTQSINDVVQAPLPVDFKEVQGYLEKLKTYSSDAQNMTTSISDSVEEYKKAYDEASNNLSRLSDATKSDADSTKTIAEETLRQMDAIQRDISTKAADIQAQVNSNNIVKNEIGARMNEMRDIKEKISDIFIDVKKSEMNAAQSAEDARKSLAGIIPTLSNNTVIQSAGEQSVGAQSVEGFTGFKTSVLEGYTVYSNPNLPSGSSNNSAFDLENNLVSKINSFNSAYYTLLGIPVTNPLSSQYTTARANLDTAKTELDTAITGLNTKIGQIGSSTPKISDAVFDASQSYIKTTVSQIDTLRSDLDMKMLEILKAKQGTPMDHTINHDAAAYTTILWTALATSALYFIFVKIE